MPELDFTKISQTIDIYDSLGQKNQILKDIRTFRLGRIIHLSQLGFEGLRVEESIIRLIGTFLIEINLVEALPDYFDYLTMQAHV